ncbi:MAG: Uma2 family endonuclease [Chloroflexota bacterium]
MVEKTSSILYVKHDDHPYMYVVAENVSAEDYMAHYAHDHHEWVKGYVLKMTPVSGTHDDKVRYLRTLIDAYFAFRQLGMTRAEPFVLKLPESRREPDIQVILNKSLPRLTETYMESPVDICIEVVSPESGPRDYGEKMLEYEAGGVREYWIIDPVRTRGIFYRLNNAGRYDGITLDDAGNYDTPLLPDFVLNVPALWGSPLPNLLQIIDSVKKMVGA